MVPIVVGSDGTLKISTQASDVAIATMTRCAEGHQIVEWAVKMLQFDTTQQADVLVNNSKITVGNNHIPKHSHTVADLIWLNNLQ